MASELPSEPGEDAPNDQGWLRATIPFKVGEGASGPMVPLLAHGLGASLAHVGLMEALFSLMAMVGSFLWGRASDRARRRRAFILLGFGGTGLALLLMALATSVPQLTAFRALHGFLLAAFVAVSGALLVERSSRTRLGEDMGRMNMVGGYAFIVGMLLGAGAVVVLDIRNLFVLAALLSLASLGVALVLIQEPTVVLRRRDIHRLLAAVAVPALVVLHRRLFNPGALIHRPKLGPLPAGVFPYLAALGAVLLGSVATFVLFPLLLLEVYRAGPTEVFLVLLGGSLLSAALYRPAGRLADRIGFRKSLTLGLGLRTAVFPSMALSVLFLPNLLFIAGINLVAGISWAFIVTAGPTALFRTFPLEERRGETMGYYNMFLGLGGALGALTGGVVAHLFGFTVLLLFSGVVTAAATLFLVRLHIR